MANTVQTYGETKIFRTSVVQVYFPGRNRSHAYYLEKFSPRDYFATLTKGLFAAILLEPQEGAIRLG